MSITFKLVLLAFGGLFVFISLLTIIIGTFSWIIDRLGWKGWVIVSVLVLIATYLLYQNLGESVIGIVNKVEGKLG